jgi:hypothetical protein
MSGNPSERETRIRDYIDGRLSGDELEAFEMALFHDPVLLDDVEATRALQRGLRELATQPVIGQVAPKPAPAQRLLPMAAAAFLLGAALPGALLWRYATSTSGGKVQIVSVETFRSGPERPAAPTYAIEAGVDRVVLEFGAVSVTGTDEFTIELRRGDAIVHREHALKPDADLLRIDVSADRLGAGDYVARIVARSPQGGETEYANAPFAVKR